MRLFIDTANIQEIEDASKWGIIDGVTTNPSLIAKEGKSLKDVITVIASLIDGPISAEVTEDAPEKMFLEGKELAGLHPNIVIKVPMTEDGIRVTKMLAKENIKVNVTLIFSVSQALLASNAGARFISPFLGRMDDAYGENKGIELLNNIVTAISLTGNNTSIIAASIRNTKHVEDSALAGSDIATIPFKVLKEMFRHPLTDKGLEIFRQSSKVKNH